MTMRPEIHPSEPDIEHQGTPFAGILAGFGIIMAGIFLGLILLPTWLPAFSASIVGQDPKFYWYLSRATAIAAFLILWLSMVFGVLMTNKLAQSWPGTAAAMDFHQFASLLGIGFALFHAFILLGDRYMSYSVAQILIPFNSQEFKPLWVGFGQLAFYLWALVAFSFYVRKRIGVKTWRLIHYVSFFSYLLALGHGIASGTDASSGWMAGGYWVSGGILLFLLVYRVLFSRAQKAEKAQRLIDRTNSTLSGRSAGEAVPTHPIRKPSV